MSLLSLTQRDTTAHDPQHQNREPRTENKWEKKKKKSGSHERLPWSFGKRSIVPAVDFGFSAGFPGTGRPGGPGRGGIDPTGILAAAPSSHPVPVRLLRSRTLFIIYNMTIPGEFEFLLYFSEH